MKRTAFLSRGRVRPVSRKVRRERGWFEAVYAEVDRRSGGRCEVYPALRAEEHHHLYRPRRSFHEARFILHVSRKAHLEFERSYAEGRRIPTTFNAATGRYDTVLIVAPDKFTARVMGAV